MSDVSKKFIGAWKNSLLSRVSRWTESTSVHTRLMMVAIAGNRQSGWFNVPDGNSALSPVQPSSLVTRQAISKWDALSARRRFSSGPATGVKWKRTVRPQITSSMTCWRRRKLSKAYSPRKGARSMVISRTPFRISFFGGGTDYPAWYRQHGGSVLGTTIDKYCYLTCRFLPPFFQHKIRIVYSQIENCHSLDDIAHPAVREILRYLDMNRGLEIHHDGDLPARSGMGSSSSFTVGLLHALYALKGQMPNKQQLAKESIHVEQTLLQETVGCQDQVLAAYGGFNHINFLPNGDIRVRPITVS